jgi:hypothetical protein
MSRRSEIGVLVAAVLLVLASSVIAQEAPRAPEGHLTIAGHDVTLNPARFSEVSGTVHAVVQFRHIPEGVEREDLASLGVTLHQYLPEFAYFCTVPNGKAPSLLGLSFVAGAEPMRPQWKAPPEVFADPAGHMSTMPGNERLIHVYFYPDTTLIEALQALQSVGALFVEPEFQINQRLEVRIPAPAVMKLFFMDQVRWVESARRPIGTKNAQAASFHGVTTARSSPLYLSGFGVNVGVMDGGGVQTNHPDFGNRVTQVESDGLGPQLHPTHVTGTILGSGANNANAKGMAPAAKAWIWKYNGDIVSKKTTGFPAYGIVVDNNSWGENIGWQVVPFGWIYYTNTTRFGAYGAQIGDLDGLAANTGTLISFAAGNDGTDDGYDGFGFTFLNGNLYYGHYDLNPANGSYSWHTGYHVTDGGTDRLGNLEPTATMKNGLSVGAFDDFGDIADFSSAGPAADGRLKPDVAAVGVDVLSTVPTSTYATEQGTSMATPVTTGIAVLVIEAWKGSHGGNRPRLDILKGLLLHSTFDLGNPGPDYRFGFGAIDANYASVLANYDNGTNPTYHRTATLSQGGSVEYLIDVSDTSFPLWVTLCWTDPPGNPAASKMLVNDLDLTLKAPSGAITYPFKLNPALPANSATRGVNTLDNVERAEVATPQAGTWKAIVKGTTVPMGSQDFAIWFGRPYLNLAPTAIAGSDVNQAATTPAGRSVSLSGSGSTDPNGVADIVDYRWDTDGDGQFYDAGGSAGGESISQVFPIGTTGVSLKVTDSFGLTGIDSVQVTVANDPPVASLGPDRVYKATDPEGRLVTLDGALCSDPQTNADIAAFEWDLDGDDSYDDATGQPVEHEFPFGTSLIGIRVRDGHGAESTATTHITVRQAENLLSHGGKVNGVLSSSSDVDSFFFEALEGSQMSLAVKTKTGVRVNLQSPTGNSVFDDAAGVGGKGFSIKGLTLPNTGWYWIDVLPFVEFSTGPYALSLTVKSPPIKGKVEDSLSTEVQERRYPVALIAGSALTAVAKGSKKVPPVPGAPSLELVGPDGVAVAKAPLGKPMKVPAVLVSGVYELRVFAENGESSLGGFQLTWKGKGPSDKVKMVEVE